MRTVSLHPTRLLLAIVFLAFFGFHLEAAAAPIVYEHWAVMVLQDKQCGFSSIITTQDLTTKQYTTTEHDEFVVMRDGVPLHIVSTSMVVEDENGIVLDFTTDDAGGGSASHIVGHRQGDSLVVQSRGPEQIINLPSLAALGPQKIRTMSKEVPLKAGQAFSFAAFSPDSPGSPIVSKGLIDRQEVRYVRGNPRKLWRLVTDSSNTPGMSSTTWIDDNHEEVEVSLVIPGIGEILSFTTDRAECMKELVGVELLAPSLIIPSRAIPNPKQQASATYRLSFKDNPKSGRTPLTLWNQDEQQVVTSGPGQFEITVTPKHYTAAEASWTLPCAAGDAFTDYLHPSAYLESNAPEIIELAHQAVGDEKNPVNAAQKIETFVSHYITNKDLNVGFASALETSKSHEGDCTEHAVLCAALGRAVGLPTRCVIGLVYLPSAPGLNKTPNGIFGFHMWAEAAISPDKWVPIDAVFNGFDVTHIAILKTALDENNPMVDLSLPLFQIMQKLKIDVLKLSSDAPPIAAAPPSISPLADTPRNTPVSAPPTQTPQVSAPAPTTSVMPSLPPLQPTHSTSVPSVSTAPELPKKNIPQVAPTGID